MVEPVPAGVDEGFGSRISSFLWNFSPGSTSLTLLRNKELIRIEQQQQTTWKCVTNSSTV